MNNPWLTIRLEDYEGHMAMPDVGQAKMLANEFGELLETYAPASVALIGCAGGNGFEEAARAGVTRLVGRHINPIYIANATARYAGRELGLETLLRRYRERHAGVATCPNGLRGFDFRVCGHC